MKNMKSITTIIGLTSIGITSYNYRPLKYNDNVNSNDINDKLIKSANDDPYILKLSRKITMFIVTSMFNGLFTLYHDTKISGDDNNYKNLVNKINYRDNNIPMITVSNHTSAIDDPSIISWIAGYEPIFREKHRWTLCKQEVCFYNDIASSFVGLGQVLPIKKGLGIDQPLFKNAARRLIDGGWIQIFPEALCVQSGQLGRGINFKECRDEAKSNEIGSLKWGVGKLIAHVRDKINNKPPIVIPFYHTGMHELLPQYNEGKENNKIIEYRLFGKGSKRIRVRVGKEIDFSDILNDYEKKYGPIRIAKVSSDGKTIENFSNSSENELQLYSDITRRIENELLRLEQESYPDMIQCMWPSWARIKGTGIIPGTN